MNRRAARFLTRLYPPKWRARYGEEFQTFLESRRVRPTEILNSVGSALSERFMRALPIILYVCVATFAASGSLYLTVSGAPMIQALDAHRALWLCWAVIEAGSLAMIIAGLAAVAPIVFRALRKPGWAILWRLARPVGVGFFVAFWAYVAGDDDWKVAGILATTLVLGAVGECFKYVSAHSELCQPLGRLMLAGLAMMSSLITIFSALYGLIGDELVTHGFSFAGPHAFRTIVLGTLAFFLAIIFAVGVTSRQRHVASKLEAL